MKKYLLKYTTASSFQPSSTKKLSKTSYKQYKQKFEQSLEDPTNPYSTRWVNRILKINYNVGLEVKSYQNGVPQFRIKKLKNKPVLPPVYNGKKTMYKTLSKRADNGNTNMNKNNNDDN